MLGTTISHYKVLEKIGEGGMGEVYRAEDTNLSRDVAIKVLPEQFTKDPQRLARFEREAKLLASLNHPNIAAIYGFEEADDVRFLAMELVPGETLAERVAKSPVPVEEALEVCRQIAEGVEAAHEKGVIHRDLKPANVKVTPEGKVKILDFGLAKVFKGETLISDIAQSPTLTEEMTRAGVILGTAAYMSPEQARGQPVDQRADIFTFGSVLYELLTGKRAFEGETITDTIASILKGEPEWDLLPQGIPSTIRFLMSRCLQKDPHRRLQHIDGARILIEEALTGATTVSPIGVSSPSGWKRALPWSIAMVAVVVAGLALWNLTSPTSTQQPALRFMLALPVNEKMANLTESPALALSPNGTRLAYVATRAGTAQLYLHTMGQLEAEPIAGTEAARSPFFSPDGQWLGFFARAKLKKVSVSGGTPVILSDVTWAGATASWGADDTIVLTPHSNSVLFQVPAGGGTPQPLTTRDSESGEGGHASPQVLPGGKAVLFTVQSTVGLQIVVKSLETGERKVVLRGAAHARYVPTGHLVYVQAGTLMAVAFDIDELETTGTPISIFQGIMQPGRSPAYPHLTFSDTGTLVYLPADTSRNLSRTLVWVNQKGAVEPLGAPPGHYFSPRFSPDGQRVVVSIFSGGQWDIWVYDIRRDTLTRLTFERGRAPLWTPDGKRVTFQSTRFGPRNLFWKPADGTGAEELLLESELPHMAHSWSPDGKVLAFSEILPSTNADIWVLPLEGERKPQLFLRTPFTETGPVFSPDGHWLAYRSNESGQDEIYVQPFPSTGAKWQISTKGGEEAVWAPSGRELFYRNGNQMMAVDITTEPTFTHGTPKLLFEGEYFSYGPRAVYDVAPDGQRFLMIKESEQVSSTQIHVVLNWFEELKRLVPTE